MACAAGLIRNNPEMKIDAVAASVGYESESSFRKAFHKVINRSPREYRDASTGNASGHCARQGARNTLGLRDQESV
jgi:transcriptional regulator GlxA family with amidase domain